MLVGGRSQLGACLAGELRQIHGVEVDRVEVPRSIDQNVFGFQIAVCPVVGDHPGGEPVEGRGQTGQPFRIAEHGGFGDRLVEVHAFDPLSEDDVHPDAALGRRVEVELPFEQPVSVDLPQMALRPQVAPQRADPSFAADAENGRGVSDVELRASRFVAAYVQLSQRAGQSAGIVEGHQVLAECEHGAYGRGVSGFRADRRVGRRICRSARGKKKTGLETRFFA